MKRNHVIVSYQKFRNRLIVVKYTKVYLLFVVSNVFRIHSHHNSNNRLVILTEDVIFFFFKLPSNVGRPLLVSLLTPRAKLNCLCYEWVHVCSAMGGFRTGNHMIASPTP